MFICFVANHWSFRGAELVGFLSLTDEERTFNDHVDWEQNLKFAGFFFFFLGHWRTLVNHCLANVCITHSASGLISHSLYSSSSVCTVCLRHSIQWSVVQPRHFFTILRWRFAKLSFPGESEDYRGDGEVTGRIAVQKRKKKNWHLLFKRHRDTVFSL